MVISNYTSFRVAYCLIKLLPYILFEKVYLAVKMASPGNQHCASCIGTLSFPKSRLQAEIFLRRQRVYNITGHSVKAFLAISKTISLPLNVFDELLSHKTLFLHTLTIQKKANVKHWTISPSI